MYTLLFPSFLLITFAASVPAKGGAATVLDDGCAADIIITEDVKYAEITTFRGDGYKDLYLSPDIGFHGINFTVKGNSWEQKTFLPVSQECVYYGQTQRWWKVRLEVLSGWSGNVLGMTFILRVSSCPFRCVINSHNKYLPNTVQVVANGPSRWREKYPYPCTTHGFTFDAPVIKECRVSNITRTTTATPTTTTTTTTTPTTTTTTTTTTSSTATTATPTTTPPGSKKSVLYIVLGTVIPAVVVVVVVVVVVRRIQQRRNNTTPPEESTSPDNTPLKENIHGRPQPPAGRQVVHEVVNDIYEPFSENIHASTGQPQPPAGRQVVHEVVNDIYEPFSENIYEEIDATHRPAGSGTVHEVKNDIYEPFNSGHSTQGTTGVNEHQANKESDDTYDRLDYHGAWGGTR